MKLICLGSGNAFVGTANFQSNFLLISSDNKKLLIDCGSDVRFALVAQGYCPNDIDGVYISHLHADHVGGLEWLGFTRKFSDSAVKPKLYISPDLTVPLWENVLSGGMESIEGVEADLSTYFDVQPVDEKVMTFDWEGCHFELVKTLHVKHRNHYRPSYGLKLHWKKKIIWLTTDLRFTPELHQEHYRDAGLILHDCEISDNPSGVHPNYREIQSLPPEIKRKIWFYHYDFGDGRVYPDVVAEGFLGLVKKGQVFDINAL